MQIAQPINHSVVAALLRRHPEVQIVSISELGCQFISRIPVTLEEIAAELKGAPTVEKVEMLPKVAVEMFVHKGQHELARLVPHDRQLVAMTRIGTYYGVGYEEGEPVDVELRIDWDGPLGKISVLPKGA